MTGTGTLNLNGRNTYTGGTLFEGGAIGLGNSGALGTTGASEFDGGTLQYTQANSTDYSGRFSTSDYQQYSIDTSGQNVTFATGLTSYGGVLVKQDGGTSTLTTVNTYTSDTIFFRGQSQRESARGLRAYPKNKSSRCSHGTPLPCPLAKLHGNGVPWLQPEISG